MSFSTHPIHTKRKYRNYRIVKIKLTNMILGRKFSIPENINSNLFYGTF